jgi:hypothetical protein
MTWGMSMVARSVREPPPKTVKSLPPEALMIKDTYLRHLSTGTVCPCHAAVKWLSGLGPP